uniref:REP-associated tyrosine transposase n=1 Tax=Hydrogenophaga sp. TaxID=1904254 RepID=UPI00356A9990
MRRYIRDRLAGATYFFTVNLAERRGNTLLVDHVDALREAFQKTRAAHPFAIDAMVVLPDHLHALWTLPQDDGDFSVRWQQIKSHFSRAVPMDERRSLSRQAKGERGIWQRRFWEHRIRDEDDFSQHVDYIHFNPVKHGLVGQVRDWPHSSFHRFVRHGKLAVDWGVGSAADDVAGEWRGAGL